MILSSADIASLAPIIYSLLLVWGLLDCFFGHPLFKITVAVFGMFAGALLGAQIGFIWFDGRWLPAVIGLVTGGIAGALLAYYCILAGAAIFGGLFGAVLIFASMQHISPEIAGVAAAVGGVVFAFISVVLVAPMIHISTAYTGALRAVIAGWYFLGGPDTLGVVSGELPGIRNLFANYIWFSIAVLSLGSLGLWYQWSKKP